MSAVIHLASKVRPSVGEIRWYWEAACRYGDYGFLEDPLPDNVTWDPDKANCKRCRKTVPWAVAHDHKRTERTQYERR